MDDVLHTYFSSATIDSARSFASGKAVLNLRSWLLQSRELALDEAQHLLRGVDRSLDRKRLYREAKIVGVGHLVFKMRPNRPPEPGMTVCWLYRLDDVVAENAAANSGAQPE